VNAKGERRVAVKEGGMEPSHAGESARQRERTERPQLRLMTGRTHQIRVHLAHAGHPVLGDDKYGDFELNRALARQGVKRLFLHAQRLALSSTGEQGEAAAGVAAAEDMLRFAIEFQTL
jgi:23S rRNA pseudouridine955/2504/2580 synthase